MENNQQLAVIQTELAKQRTEKEPLIKLQQFTQLLNTEPDKLTLTDTPDKKAKTIPISHIEMLLDTLFFGQWSTSEPTYQQVFNEVVGTLTLTVTHPFSGEKITRVGYAAIIIQQDKDAVLADFNATKKKNALDLAFPKLKAECLKNAAGSLGKIFGRDINRKENVAKFEGRAAIRVSPQQEIQVIIAGSVATEEQLEVLLSDITDKKQIERIRKGILLRQQFDLKSQSPHLKPDDYNHIERIIKNHEHASYDSVLKILKDL